MADLRDEFRLVSPRWQTATKGAIGAVVVLGVVAVFVMRQLTQGLVESEEAGHEAVLVAQEAIPVILSYTGTTLAQEVAADRALMTPAYATRHEAMVLAQVLPEAENHAVTNEVGIVSVGVVEESADHVTVLLFANQTTRTEARPHGVTQGIRLEVDLQRDDGDWLIDDIRPL